MEWQTTSLIDIKLLKIYCCNKKQYLLLKIEILE